MKAIIAQRSRIEALEKDKSDQNMTIQNLEKEVEDKSECSKQLEKMKKQRLDLLDKSDEYNEQVKDNKKLQHELEHLTTYFKDS